MKKAILIIVCNISLTLSYGQDAKIKAMVDSLRLMTADTLDCSASLYWRIIAQGDKAIPYLIDKLTDTTQLRARFHNKKTPLNVGEVAQFALNEIAYFPAFLITHIQFDTGNFYDFLFDNTNKALYQKDIQEWYAKEKKNYKLERILKAKQTDCQARYGINKFFRWNR